MMGLRQANVAEKQSAINPDGDTGNVGDAQKDHYAAVDINVRITDYARKLY